jgi:hypothetical protein
MLGGSKDNGRAVDQVHCQTAGSMSLPDLIGQPSIPEASVVSTKGLWDTGYPACAGYDSGENVKQYSRGMICPSCASSASLGNQRAQGMPDADRTRGLVCSVESTRVRNRGYAEHSGIPCAMVYGLCRALPGVRALIATVVERNICFAQLDLSIGRPGPHGFAVRIARNVQAHQRVHRIPLPTSVTIAKRPSW